MLGNLPVFKIHPQSTTLLLDSINLYFSLTCEADGALSYHWKKIGGKISPNSSGITTNTLTFINLQPTDSGNYYCIAVNGSGRRLSDIAAITVKGTKYMYIHSYLHV